MDDVFANRFRIVEPLGEGGMASVWRAVDRDGGEVALKVLDAKFATKTKMRARFANEARTMSSLRHPNIVRVVDSGETDGAPWLAMEVLDGGSAQGWLKRHGPMPPRMAAELVCAVLSGLAAAHAHDVVHRDVKPHNVLLASDGSIKLTDFGIAHLDEDSGLTRTGAVMGTWAYMAPEQRTDSKHVDGRADVFGAGAVLYALLAGADPVDLLAPEAVDTLGAPAELTEVIRRSTRFRRDNRYPDVHAMRADLAIALEMLPADPPGTPPLCEAVLGPLPAIPVATFDAPVEARGDAVSFPDGWAPASEAPKAPHRPPPRRASAAPAPPLSLPYDTPPLAPSYLAEPEPAPPVAAPPPANKPTAPPPKRFGPLFYATLAFAALSSAMLTAVALVLLAPSPVAAPVEPPTSIDPSSPPDPATSDPGQPAPDGAPRGSAPGEDAPPAAPMGRLMVLSLEPAHLTIDGTDVGDAPIEAAINLGTHTIDLKPYNSTKQIRLRTRVSEGQESQVCWSFANNSYCDEAETDVAMKRLAPP